MSDTWRVILVGTGFVLFVLGVIFLADRSNTKRRTYIIGQCSRPDIVAVEYVPGGWGSSMKTVLRLESGGTVVLAGGHYSVAETQEGQ